MHSYNQTFFIGEIMKISRRNLKILIESMLNEKTYTGEEIVNMFNFWIKSSMSDNQNKVYRGRIKTIIGGIERKEYKKSLAALQGLVKGEPNLSNDAYDEIVKVLKAVIGEPETKKASGQAAKKPRKSISVDGDVQDIQANLNKIKKLGFISGDYQGKSLTEDGKWGSRSRSASSEFLKVFIDDHLDAMTAHNDVYLDVSATSADLNLEKQGGAGNWLITSQRLYADTSVQGTPSSKYYQLDYLLEDFLEMVKTTGASPESVPDAGTSDVDFQPLPPEDQSFPGFQDEGTTGKQVNILNMSYSDLKELGFWRDIISGGAEKQKTIAIQDFADSEISIRWTNPGSGKQSTQVLKRKNSTVISTNSTDARKLFGGAPITISSTSAEWRKIAFGGNPVPDVDAQIVIEFPSGSYDVLINGKDMQSNRMKIKGLSWTGSKDKMMVAPTKDIKEFLSETKRNNQKNIIKESLSRGSLYRNRYRRY